MLRKYTEGEGHLIKVSGTRVSIITSADVELRICKATLSGFSRLPPSGLIPPPPGVLEDAVAGVRYGVSCGGIYKRGAKIRLRICFYYAIFPVVHLSPFKNFRGEITSICLRHNFQCLISSLVQSCTANAVICYEARARIR